MSVLPIRNIWEFLFLHLTGIWSCHSLRLLVRGAEITGVQYCILQDIHIHDVNLMRGQSLIPAWHEEYRWWNFCVWYVFGLCYLSGLKSPLLAWHLLRYDHPFLLIFLGQYLPIDLWLLTSVLFLVPDCLLGLTSCLILDLLMTLRNHSLNPGLTAVHSLARRWKPLE